MVDKREQGRYTRMVAFWALFLLLAYGLLGEFVPFANKWLGQAGLSVRPWLQVPVPLLGEFTPGTALGLVLLLIASAGIYYFLSRSRTTAYLAETELEMRKVVWPTWSETWSGTCAVIATVVVLLGFLMGADWLLLKSFSYVLNLGN